MEQTKDKLRISFSEYSTFISCPHKWYLNYFLRLPGDVSDELVFGSAVHSTIEEIAGNKLIQRLYKADKEKVARDIFKGSLKDELERIEDVTFLEKFKKGELARIFMYQAEKLITELDYFNRFKDYDVAHIEYKLDGLKLNENERCQIIYKGFVDMILKHKHDDTYLILDWKTSKAPWDIEKKIKENNNFFAQLCLYKYFFGRECNIPYQNIYTKFYNLPRDAPKEQRAYNGNLTQSYIDSFINEFSNVCYEIYEKRQNAINFNKVKMLTKKNFCHRCKYNTVEHCNDTDEFQQVSVGS